MENPSHNQGSPAPPRRSRTKRDPSEDQVYRVPPQDFAHTVQKLTGGAASSSPAATSRPSSQPRPPALSVSTPASRTMQEAYLAWCASNNVVLSPGTMAEMERAGADQFKD